MTERAVRCLSIHAQYRCRDSGACCTAGWPIPVEIARLDVLQNALASGQLALADGRRGLTDAFDAPPDAPEETPALLKTADAACVFYRRAGGARCEIHRALGHDALPLACRQFPRVSVIDPRGVSVTLSHFCPTAASLLDADPPVSILERAPAFPADGEYVGLDVRGDLPPSLRPDCLMEWESWWTWERLAVDYLSGADAPARALADLAAVVEDVRTWRPSDGALLDRIHAAFARAGPGAPPSRAFDHHARFAEILDAIPADLRPAAAQRERVEPAPPVAVVRNLLVAHAFASWTAHLGQGLRTWLRAVEAAFAVVELGGGVRRADLLLRHLSDPHALAAVWSGSETRIQT
jgi:hypothetical protein